MIKSKKMQWSDSFFRQETSAFKLEINENDKNREILESARLKQTVMSKVLSEEIGISSIT